jgi:hypothetical protein
MPWAIAHRRSSFRTKSDAYLQSANSIQSSVSNRHEAIRVVRCAFAWSEACQTQEKSQNRIPAKSGSLEAPSEVLRMC